MKEVADLGRQNLQAYDIAHICSRKEKRVGTGYQEPKTRPEKSDPGQQGSGAMVTCRGPTPGPEWPGFIILTMLSQSLRPRKERGMFFLEVRHDTLGPLSCRILNREDPCRIIG